jgi:Protein of unknown function (DUF4232)
MLRRIALPLGLAAVATAALGPVSSARPNASGLCTGSVLAGAFKAIPGSAGAGNIVYRLRVENTSKHACGVTGLPALTLLDSAGGKLPTRARFAGTPGTLTAVLVRLAPGGIATLTARFSPDIPGPGEPVSGRACEPTAYRLRVAPSGGGSVVVPISPATPVCEHGSLQIGVFTRG